MNIFYLSDNPNKAATYLIDRHVNKMITESAQILQTCFTLDQLDHAPLTQYGTLRGHSHFNHPCCKWARQTKGNFLWLVEHAYAMNEERMFRKNDSVPHFSIGFIDWAFKHIDDSVCSDSYGMTKPALAMKNYSQFMGPDPILSYRKFYVADKRFDKSGRKMDIWTRRNRPEWWNEISALIQAN
jgi:hypothetical protein